VELKELQSKYTQGGIVVSLAVRPEPMRETKICESVNAIEDRGLEDDRYNNKGGSRQVTLIQQEHLHAVASFLGKEKIDFTLTRRNIVVKGINLLSLKEKSFQIGDAVFQYSGECHPCSRMERNLGLGGYNAMRGHGGVTAKVLQGGIINVGDRVVVL
jgi:MOSC domain-containing protein YiiM